MVAALLANDPDAFRDFLSEGIQEHGLTEVEELLLAWLNSFLIAEEQDRLMAGTWGEFPARIWNEARLKNPSAGGVDSQLELRQLFRDLLLWPLYQKQLFESRLP